MENNIIPNVMKEMIIYFGNDVRRINHALKVYSFAKNIGELVITNKENMENLEISALLHDIGIKESERKYNSSAGNYQEIEGPKVALKILSKFNLEKKNVDRICYLIGHHHTYDKIDNIDFQILIEADFLVNIFEDNLKKEQILNIKEKYFKTIIGKEYLSSIYINS